MTQPELPNLGLSGGKRRIKELDGIRGIAILLVMMTHFGGINPSSNIESAWNHFANICWIGVDIFFVLSGFLITEILVETKGFANYLKAFYMRRVLRIFPLYYACVFTFFCIVVPIGKLIGRWPDIAWTEQLWYWTYTSNIRTAYVDFVRPFQHFWSLALEEQFYLVWPFMVMKYSEKHLKWICIGGLLLSPLLRIVAVLYFPHAGGVDFVYRLTPFRIDSLLWGALACLMLKSNYIAAIPNQSPRLLIVGGAFITTFFALVALGQNTHEYAPLLSTVGYSLLGAASALLILHAVLRSESKTIYCRVVRSPGLTKFGKYSYGLYVWHLPFSLYIPNIFRRMHVPELYVGLASFLLGSIVTYLTALLSWRYLETPFLRLKDRFGYGTGKFDNATVAFTST